MSGVSGQEREHRSEERASEERSAPRKRNEDMVSSDNAEPTTTYEQAREELADVVRRLEAGGLTLEESLALWERGEELATLCQHWLDRARERLAAAAPADQPE
jgi:exodeoxyribonuclease VII small subunit